LELNKHLAARHRLATRVELELKAAEPLGETTRLRAEHQVAWRLLESDLQRIATAEARLATFAPLSVAEYHAIESDRPPVDQARRPKAELK